MSTAVNRSTISLRGERSESVRDKSSSLKQMSRGRIS